MSMVLPSSSPSSISKSILPPLVRFDATRQTRLMEKKANHQIKNGNPELEHSGVPVWHLPILAMTADVTKATYEECMKYGMDGYVSQPFEEEQLYQAVFFASKPNPDSSQRFPYTRQLTDPHVTIAVSQMLTSSLCSDSMPVFTIRCCWGFTLHQYHVRPVKFLEQKVLQTNESYRIGCSTSMNLLPGRGCKLFHFLHQLPSCQQECTGYIYIVITL